MFVRTTILGLAAMLSAVAAAAQGLSVSDKTRGGLMVYQLNVLDGRADAKYADPIAIAPPRVVIPGTPEALAGPETATPQADSPYLQTARAAARRYAVPQAIFLRLVQRESGWDPRAVSPKGAVGLAQLMPQTARLLRVDARNPTENLMGGARYLRMMRDRFGSWRLALAAYNAGPDMVELYNDVPPFTETRDYVRAILAEQ